MEERKKYKYTEEECLWLTPRVKHLGTQRSLFEYISVHHVPRINASLVWDCASLDQPPEPSWVSAA